MLDLVGAVMQQQVIEIRASALPKAFDCALMFEAECLNGVRRPGTASALIGTAMHGGTAAFDQARLDHRPISLDDAEGAAVDTMRERIATEGVRWVDDEPSRAGAERIARTLTRRYCADISPRYEFEAVELTTKPLNVDCGGGVAIRLTGTLDRSRIRRVTSASVARHPSPGHAATAPVLRRGLSDLKSGRHAVTRGVAGVARHKPQLGVYEALYEHTTGHRLEEPAEIIGINTTGRFAHGAGQAVGCRDLVLGTPGKPGLLSLVAQMVRTGIFPPNPRSLLCSEKHCAFYDRCRYAGL